MKDILLKLSGGPESHIDPLFAERIGKIAETDFTAEDIKKLLDDGAYYSLCSDFVMTALDIIWKEKLKEQEKASS